MSEGIVTKVRQSVGTAVRGARPMLPYAAIGLGVALLVVVIIGLTMKTGAHVRGAQVAPAYNNYQTDGPIDRTGQPIGYSLDGAIDPAPVSTTGTSNMEATLCGGENFVCMDPTSVNYSPDKTKCPCVNCCTRKIYGCLDKDNANFNPWANAHDQRFCANHVACKPLVATDLKLDEEPVGMASAGASVVPFDGGCYAPYDTPLLGGVKSCGV